MSSLWNLGEHSGYHGAELDVGRIACPFCEEKGNFSRAAHCEKKKPNGSKRLNFDTLKCGNCGGFVMVFWSGGDSLHDFRVLPWPLTYTKYPEYWPADLGRFWLQAKRSLESDNVDAAIVMARSAMQFALRDNGAVGKSLFHEIADLTSKGILPPIMKDWAGNVRELGNDSAHPKPGEEAPASKDAEDIIRFLDFLLEYLYRLPHDIAQYRERRS